MISLLSWNICWGCMASDSSSKNDTTAAKLGLFCEKLKKKTGRNVCLNNVSSFLKKTSYDIIALQESKNWQDIYPSIKQNYFFINFTSTHPVNKSLVDITTFYNFKRFQLLGVYVGNVANDDVRPYQYILFQDIKTNKKFYFINLHNGHLISKPYLQKQLNSNNKFLTGKKNMDILITTDKITVNGQKSLFTNVSKQNYPLILGGDLNDHGKYNYWKGLHINKNWLSCKKKPPETCCTPVKNKYIWLGSPSIIYNANLREKNLGIELDFIFDITTFSSTACVTSNAVNNKDLNLCSTLNSLKNFCNADKFRSHEAKSGKLPDFIVDISKAKSKIIEEQRAIEKDEEEEPYQRYNEVLAYFFPWEIFGIEVGGYKHVPKELHDKLVKERNDLIHYYKQINYLKMIELINDTTYEISNPWFDCNNAEYLLVKYIKEYTCIKKITVTEEFVQKVVSNIIKELSKPVPYYEYGRTSLKPHFELYERKTPSRFTDFEVFTQTATPDFLTHIKKYNGFQSSLNLSKKEVASFSYNNFCKKNKYPLICRCLLVETQNKKNYGKVIIDDFIEEIFKGRLHRNWAPHKLLNLVVNPATIILPNANVILTSQIFDRDFAKNTKIKTPSTYHDYLDSLNIGLRTNRFDNDIKFGDYFLTSKDFTVIDENNIPDQLLKLKSSIKYPTSDHLPVEMKVEFKHSKTKKKHYSKSKSKSYKKKVF
jgi:endonuclease/exonuclease/phosphatase family metal-dependent hydrolase